MDNTSNRSIVFLTLSFVCIWLVLDNIWGKQYLDRFLNAVFPFYNVTIKGEEEEEEEEEEETVIEPGEDSDKTNGDLSDGEYVDIPPFGMA